MPFVGQLIRPVLHAKISAFDICKTCPVVVLVYIINRNVSQYNTIYQLMYNSSYHCSGIHLLKKSDFILVTEDERTKFRDSILSLEQQLEASKGREQALQKRLLKEVDEFMERYKEQVKRCSELEVCCYTTII